MLIYSLIYIARTPEDEKEIMKNLYKVAKQFQYKLAQNDMSPLADLLAVLRAGYLIQQTHHWQSKSDVYYGDHLLYQRIYEESLEFIDGVAERAVGSGSAELVNAPDQMTKMHEFVNWAFQQVNGNSPDELAKRALMVEERIVEEIKKTIETLESRDALSHGTSNLLEGAADKHETFIYLLRRRNEE